MVLWHNFSWSLSILVAQLFVPLRYSLRSDIIADIASLARVNVERHVSARTHCCAQPAIFALSALNLRARALSCPALPRPACSQLTSVTADAPLDGFSVLLPRRDFRVCVPDYTIDGRPSSWPCRRPLAHLPGDAFSGSGCRERPEAREVGGERRADAAD